MDLIGISSIAQILVSTDPVIQKLWWFADLLQTTPDFKRSLRLKLNRGEVSHRDCFSEIIQGWVSLKGSEATVGSLVDLLEEMDCISVAEHILTKFPSNYLLQSTSERSAGITSNVSKNQGIEGFSNCDAPYNFFVGRENELQEILKVVEDPEDCNLVLISGLAGIGKTEMTRKFCNNIYREKRKGISCLWFLAEDEKILQSQLRETAKKLKLEHSHLDECNELFRLILDNIKTQAVLIVFDNVDLRNLDVEKILEEYFRKDEIVFIVTTRDKTMFQEFNPIPIDLEVLSLESAIQCIAGPLKLDVNEKNVRNQLILLCEEIECYSLALRQGVAYIQRQRKVGVLGKEFNVSHYIEKLKSADRIKLLGMENFDHKYKSSTLKTMCVTLNHISSSEDGEGAIRLLRLISYIPPENIKVKKLQKLNISYLKRQGKDVATLEKNEFDCLIKILKSFCLIQSECGVISIHRLVQEVSKNYYKDWILLDAEILISVDFNLIRTESYKNYMYIASFVPLGIPDTWEEEIHLTVLRECESQEFPNFLRKRGKAFLIMFSEYFQNRNFDTNSVLKVIKCFRKTFGTLCYPAVVEIIATLLQRSKDEDKRNLAEQLWQDCFPLEGSLELGIGWEHELFVPFEEWTCSTSILGTFMMEVAKYFEAKGEWEKCLSWMPRWRLVRDGYFRDSVLYYNCSSPFPIYFRVLFKLGRLSEATEFFNEEFGVWKEQNFWMFFHEIHECCHESTKVEVAFDVFLHSHIREHILIGLGELSSNIRNCNSTLRTSDMVDDFLGPIVGDFEKEDLSFFRYFKNDDELFCEKVNELKTALKLFCNENPYSVVDYDRTRNLIEILDFVTPCA